MTLFPDECPRCYCKLETSANGLRYCKECNWYEEQRVVAKQVKKWHDYIKVVQVRRLCIERGCGNITTRTRCEEHSPTMGINGLPRTNYDSNWRKLSEQARKEQPWCTICGSTHNLSLDHVIPGTTQGGLMVLCRSCNSRKSAQDRKLRHEIGKL